MRERDKLAAVKKLYSGPSSIEAILAYLRDQNTSKIESIRLLHLGTGIGLSEAKKLVFVSRTWSDRFQSDEKFLDSLLQGLKENNSEAA